MNEDGTAVHDPILELLKGHLGPLAIVPPHIIAYFNVDSFYRLDQRARGVVIPFFKLNFFPFSLLREMFIKARTPPFIVDQCESFYNDVIPHKSGPFYTQNLTKNKKVYGRSLRTLRQERAKHQQNQVY